MTTGMRGFLYAGVMLAAVSASGAANADVALSTAATQNMTCSSGVCAPTSANAVLNVNDLQTLLASGNVEVTTTGSGVQANNLDVNAALTWSSTNTLALDAYDSIAFANPVSITGVAGLALTTNDGGSGGMLSFGSGGSVTIQNLSSRLTINGNAYTLANTVRSLASAIASDPGGNYALAEDYDASGDGTYQASPVPEVLGNVEGLGNTISNLTVQPPSFGTRNVPGKRVPGAAYLGGLFESNGGTIEDLNLANVFVDFPKVKGSQDNILGGLVAYSDGLLFGDHVSGQIHGAGAIEGGLAGYNTGTIANSSADARVISDKTIAGGLVGTNAGPISGSFATGPANGAAFAGGLVGDNGAAISNSYATGATKGTKSTRDTAYVGGLIGGNGNQKNTALVSASYSTGLVGGIGIKGGFIGEAVGTSGLTDCDWDTTTSKMSSGVGSGSDTGLTGLTTKKLKSGLPTGFDPTVWAESPSINNGLPYLIANPPR